MALFRAVFIQLGALIEVYNFATALQKKQSRINAKDKKQNSSCY
jgi:hypothetical protein